MAIRYANDKIFWCFDNYEPTSDFKQNDLQRKSSLIIISDVDMTSKRAFLQKSNIFTKLNYQLV